MGELGDLLEAIHDAPSASSLHAKVRHAWDANLVHGAIERANRRSGSMGALGMISTTGDGAPPPAGRRIYFLQYLVPLSWLGARRLRIVGDEQHAALVSLFGEDAPECSELDAVDESCPDSEEEDDGA